MVKSRPSPLVVEEDLVACPLCLSGHSVRIKVDRHGSPFAHCRVCATRVFMKGSAALAGFAAFSQEVDSMHERMAKDPSFVAKIAKAHRALLETIRAPIPAIAEAVEAALAPVAAEKVA